MNQKLYIWIGGAVIVVLFAAIGVWLFLRPTSPSATTNAGGFFGVATDNGGSSATDNGQNGTQVIDTTGSGSATSQKIFEISADAVAGATLIQTLHPTTTLARYIKQEDGHVYDLPLDVAGAVPRVVSNITIPGGQRVLWAEGGQAALMQYIDGGSVKTVYLGFPAATTTNVILPTRILFLPDNIEDIAVSPDGKSAAYLLKTSAGVDGYITRDDGTSGKKVFSLPLSQVLVSWPSTNTLLAQSKSAAGVEGIALSIDVKSGAVTPLVQAQGLTAMSNTSFTKVIYQTVQNGAASRASYIHDVKSGTDTKMAFNPFPEKCLASSFAPSTLYCATPLQDIPAAYLDLWHAGAASYGDTVYSFDLTSNRGSILVIPGSTDGGGASDILEMALSPNARYLSFTTKGDRSLWGVRLGS